MFSKNCFYALTQVLLCVYSCFVDPKNPSDWIESNPKVCEYASTTPSCGGDPGTLLLVVASRIVFQIPFVAYCFVANQKTEICRRSANGVFIFDGLQKWELVSLLGAWGQYTVHSVCGVCVAQPNHMVHKANGGSIWFKLPKIFEFLRVEFRKFDSNCWKKLLRLEMIVPEAHMGACMELATQRRGIYRCKTAKKPPTWPAPPTVFYVDFLYVYKKNMAFQRFWTIYKSLKVCSFILLRFTRTTNFLTQGRTLLEYEFLGN